jgi:hypothetical protein
LAGNAILNYQTGGRKKENDAPCLIILKELKKYNVFKKIKKIVKPKNFKVMKKFLFSLMALVTLVLVANTTFAAAGDTYEPFVGQTKTYSIGTLTAGDGYELWVTNSTTDPNGSGDAVALTIAEMGTPVDNGTTATNGTTNGSTAYSSGTLSTGASSVSVSIKWTTSASTSSNPDYYLWIKMTTPGANGCTNWRYKGIDVNSYVVDFVVYAYGTDNFTTSPTVGTDAALTCQTQEGANYNADAASDGSTTVYFRVSRVATNSVVNAWTFTPTLTYTNLATSATVVVTPSSLTYGTTTAATGSTLASGSQISVASGTNEIYMKLVIPAYTAADLGIKLDIGTTGVDTGALADDDNTTTSTPSANNSASDQLKRLPSIGAFN